MSKTALFDLDGTLLNSLEDIALCANRALEISGLPQHKTERYRDFIGWGSRVLVERMMSPEDHAAYGEKVFSDYTLLYSDLCVSQCTLYPGALDLLRELRGAGYKTAVVTNKPHLLAQSVLSSSFEGTLDLAVGQRDGVPPKPDPTALLEALEQLGGTKENAVYIGDSQVDILTGRAGGIYTIGVTWGYQAKEQLEELNPDAMAGTMEELREKIFARG